MANPGHDAHADKARDELSPEEIVRRGEALYEQTIRQRVEPACIGQYVVLDIDTGEYEIDADESAAFQRARAKRPSGVRFLKRVGYGAAHRIGGRLSATRP